MLFMLLMGAICDIAKSTYEEDREQLKKRLESYGPGEVIDCKAY